ncbi:MAG: hypothetical protein U0228_29585 [Myxococcaceae bacterium]
MKKKRWTPPQVVSLPAPPPPVLLLCTGAYNCVIEAGYDCCQPTSAECGNC